MGLVDVAVAGRTGRPGERGGEVGRVVRPHVVHRALVGGALQACEQRVRPTKEVVAGRECECRDSNRVRRSHRGALQPAEALAGELEAGGVEERRGDRIGADQTLVLEGAE